MANYRFGKHPPKVDYRTLRFKDYLKPGIAAVAHAITVYRGLLKTKKIMPQAAVEKLYYHLTGGPDTGLNELDVLNYWRANPVVADEILAYAKIDRRITRTSSNPYKYLAACIWDSKCNKTAFRTSTIINRGRPARCSMKATRSMPWPTTGTA